MKNHLDACSVWTPTLRGAVVLVDKKIFVQHRVKGGRSIDNVTSGRDFLHQDVPAASKIALPDAVQRLCDLLVVSPGDAALRNAFNITIADRRAWIELTEMRGHKIDLRVMSLSRSGACPFVLLKLYLKLRFSELFDSFYRSRYGK